MISIHLYSADIWFSGMQSPPVWYSVGPQYVDLLKDQNRSMYWQANTGFDNPGLIGIYSIHTKYSVIHSCDRQIKTTAILYVRTRAPGIY
jgi:hypothetical protein